MTKAIYALTISILLFALSLIYEKNQLKWRNKYRKYRKGKISRFIKRVLSKILTLLWCLYFTICLYLIYKSANYERLFISAILILTIIALNYTKNLLAVNLLSFAEIISFIWKKTSPTKSFSRKFKRLLILSLKDILLFSLIIISFSFDILVTGITYRIIGVTLVLFILTYLIGSLIDLFLMQKDLLLVADTLEIINERISGWRESDRLSTFTKIVAPFLFGILNRNFVSKDKLLTQIESLKTKIKKLRFFSRYGLSFFKIALTSKLVFILLMTLAVSVIAQSNYYFSLYNLGFIESNGISFSGLLLNSFYIFIGENVDYLTYNTSQDFFNIITFAFAFIGWFLVVSFIIMFIDIVTISMDEFTSSVKSLVDSLMPDAVSFLDNVKYVEGIEVNTDSVSEITKRYNSDGKLPDDLIESTLKSIESTEQLLVTIREAKKGG